MKQNKKQLENLLDETIASIHHAQPEAAHIEDAARRVWARLETHANSDYAMNEIKLESASTAPAAQVRGCADFQTLMPSYMRHQLSPARALLLEDHTRECVACRHAMQELKDARHQVANGNFVGLETKNQRVRESKRAHRASPFFQTVSHVAQWRVAAAAVVLVAVVALAVWQPFAPMSAVNMSVEAADGALYRIAANDTASLTTGDRFGVNDQVLTAKNAQATLRLSDGSLVEMRERSQLAVEENRDGATINLERGQIIVQAAAQGNKSLSVRTNDALVAVKGTTFSVNSGTRASRIAVIEGAVKVETDGKQNLLHAGEQAATRKGLEAVPVAQEISWSKNAARYRQMLAEAKGIRADIDARVTRPGRRYSTRLLDLTATGTVFYVGLPNWGESLTQAHNLLQERLAQNPALAGWWQGQNTNNANDTKREERINFLMERVRAWGSQLGDEIVVSATLDAQGEPAPLVLAEVKNANGFRDFLNGEIETLKAQSGGKVSIQVIDDLSKVNDVTPPASSDAVKKSPRDSSRRDSMRRNKPQDKASPELFVWIHDGFVFASPRVDALRGVAAKLESGNAIPDAFHQRLADAYRDGTNFILAADLATILTRRDVITQDASTQNTAQDIAKRDAMLHQTGFDDLQFLIVESKDSETRTENIATVSFKGARRGMAAWLAAPHAMGALDFISRDANLAAAFVVKQPATIVDDLFATLRSVEPEALTGIETAQNESGVNLRADLAATLGGEFAFAIDGALLPVPSWKLIAEVYQPAKLHETMTRLVAKANERLRAENKPVMELVTSELGGHTYHTIKCAGFPVEFNYTFADGYFIAAPSRALLARALETKASGDNLRQSPRFLAALPQGSDPNYSALFYQNFASAFDTLAPFAERFAKKQNGNAPHGQPRPADIIARVPAVAYAQAFDDRIVINAPSKDAPFGITPATLLGLPGGSFSMSDVIKQGTTEP
ncbi:MAG: FecR domain-containing protein [Pyrinomonadaceae bacterium MAG19_C2-C3]|nr:FecR domain-containing protein [Pyrinomonadaceae bacterium MAG19_C2-C3]